MFGGFAKGRSSPKMFCYKNEIDSRSLGIRKIVMVANVSEKVRKVSLQHLQVMSLIKFWVNSCNRKNLTCTLTAPRNIKESKSAGTSLSLSFFLVIKFAIFQTSLGVQER